MVIKAFVFRPTKSVVWDDVHVSHPRCMAYETHTHFVNVYGQADGLWTVSNGLTIAEVKQGTLRHWIETNFGGVDIEETKHPVGETVTGVWRPGLFYDAEMLGALGATQSELRSAEQVLLLLVQRLDELLLFIEPTKSTLQTFGHKSRELLILACTEIESLWRHYLELAGLNPPKHGFNTNDYVRLVRPLFLEEFEVTLPRHKDVPSIRPYLGWNVHPSPTTTLGWYAAYNKAKHDRRNYFFEASLLRCIEAVAANLIMFSVRFGPYRLYHGAGPLAALFNANFSISIRECSPDEFYVPELKVENWQRRTWGRAEIEQRRPIPFKL